MSSRVPLLEQPLASQSQEGFDVSFTGFSVEDVDFPMNTVPTEVASSQATPLDERPVQDSHVSHDNLDCGCLILSDEQCLSLQIDTPEYKAAEERRRQRAQHSRETKEKANRSFFDLMSY